MAVAAALLGACGDDPAVEQTTQPAPGQATPLPTTTTTTTTTTTVPAGRSYSSDLTSSDGYRYTITLVVGAGSSAATAGDCPPPAGGYVLPVTLTVANQATDRPAPFPPLRVELTTSPGTRPGQVLLKDTAGTCTFAPRAPSIGPGASLVFKGTTPAIDERAAAGTAGRIEVKASESTFTLAAPVP